MPNRRYFIPLLRVRVLPVRVLGRFRIRSKRMTVSRLKLILPSQVGVSGGLREIPCVAQDPLGVGGIRFSPRTFLAVESDAARISALSRMRP
jgi:hypothetical protein